MKLVINGCYGGFSLSPEAVAAIAKRKGRDCYFFKHNYSLDEYEPLSLDEAAKSLMFVAFDVPNPKEVLGSDKDWHSMSGPEREANNRKYREHAVDHSPSDRTDPDLVAVVEELGPKADGQCAKLRVVEIPDGVEWELDEYDGIESVHESHRSWS